MKNSFKQGISKFVTRLLIWVGLHRQKAEAKPVGFILQTRHHNDDFPDVNIAIGSTPEKPASAKWDADDWIKYKKENPSYYDEDGRSYRY